MAIESRLDWTGMVCGKSVVKNEGAAETRTEIVSLMEFELYG
ncbi:predicted protein [Sclerotinia sclerotiorum 1980 UF-70]|uniref:Uncharacterized protein n=1 Tax=Sclerotinia sclerotiorum (strain ATCC 18683 / 1980 / Ss-1) TaxID=665079 RepID=A7F4J1_SCLS1|nr:predicted protein [Sclerotinia sclerotiorum 1980 UF-70]EDN97662.1 predicted protein [Sclerotinia sclerotiorum 1980 UF-70]